MSDSSRCAQAVIGQLIAQGVTDVVLAPGSRSAPFALALEAAATAGLLRLHVRIDERSAGFLALGLAKGSGHTAAVVTTSGTAVGNLLPAVMEAHHSAIPLLVISADRPSWMVGFGANQTTEQTQIFSAFVTYSARVAAAAPPASWNAQAARAVLMAEGATGGRRGPAQLNVELPEPLVDAAVAAPQLPAAVIAGPPGEPVVVALDGRPRTVVICGDADLETGRIAAELAEGAGLPLIAEPSSNARSGATAIATGRLLMAGELGAQVERAIVFGRPTLSRPVNAVLARADVDVVVVTDRSDFSDPGWRAHQIVQAVAVQVGPRPWLDAWRRADRERSAAVAELIAADEPVTGPRLAALVVEAVLGDQVLCLGNSNAIRDADLAGAWADAGPCYANRGLSGIDGTISTAVGIALASGSPTVLLCGDLSFLHDVGGLLIGPGEPRPELRVIVADDDGGSIFATLEYAGAQFSHSFERVFATPTGRDLVALAAAYGVPARRLHTEAEVRAALSEPIIGMEVLVVEVDRASRADLSTRINQS